MSHIAPKSMYYTIFGILMVMTGLTVFAAFHHLGVFNFPVAIGIAITKATLVVLFFMHALYSRPLTWVFLGAGILCLIILFTFTLADYATRDNVGAGPLAGAPAANPSLSR